MYLEIYMYKLANSDVFSESNGFRHKNVKKNRYCWNYHPNPCEQRIYDFHPRQSEIKIENIILNDTFVTEQIELYIWGCKWSRGANRTCPVAGRMNIGMQRLVLGRHIETKNILLIVSFLFKCNILALPYTGICNFMALHHI